jgi:protein MpaA
MRLLKKFIIYSILCSATLVFAAKEDKPPSGKKLSVTDMMSEIQDRTSKFNWDTSFFTKEGWQEHGSSIYGRPLVYWTCGNPKNENSSLILANVHGDEITPVYFGFRLVEWLKARPEICEKSFVVVAPLVNPDGFLRYTTGTRTNYNKVDLNRNFDTPEWPSNAQKIWKEKYGSQRRYFPGDTAASEPEVIFQKWLITQFHPTKILSIHAPLNHLDFDGPVSGPNNPEIQKFTKAYIDSCDFLKKELEKSNSGLKLVVFGTFPGSLGNYAGRLRGIPTITTELPTMDYKMAPIYFSKMEDAVKIFITYELKDRPKPLASQE